MRNLAVNLLCTLALLAQTESTNTGTISGIVKDAATGQPIADANVILNQSTPGDTRQAKTDNQGAYVLSAVKPGQYRITAQTPPHLSTMFPSTSTRMVELGPGQTVASVNFAIQLPGTISGKVLDQNDEPVAGASVILVAREYAAGALRYVYAGTASTDDGGGYKLQRVMPGRGYLVMVAKRTLKLDAISEAPLDPKLRRPAFAATYYPGVTDLESAQAFVLRPAEHRENVDVRIHRTQSYCIAATVQTPNGPEPLRFTIRQKQPHSGYSGDGGTFMSEPGGVTGRDGKLRVCGLAPGEYRVNAWTEGSNPPNFYGLGDLQILDRDVHNVVIVARSRVPVTGEVVWDGGKGPEKPVDSKLNLWLRPMTRAMWQGEQNTHRVDIPGTFTMADIMMDAYRLDVMQGIPSDAYVKEISYGGKDLRVEPFVPGASVGPANVRIVLARDGGTIAAKVSDSDGNAVPDCRVLIVPLHADSEAAFASRIVSGQCDQNGSWKSRLVAPGKYGVLALPVAHNNSPEIIGKLWAMRSKAKEVEVTVNGNAQVNLLPLGFE